MSRFVFCLLIFLWGCGNGDTARQNQGAGDHAVGHDHGEGGHSHGPAESWLVTAWGERFEIFAEADPLLAGGSSDVFTHVTVLDGFTPLVEGAVSITLQSVSTGEERLPVAGEFVRDGIFRITLDTESGGDFDLYFTVRHGDQAETLRAGRVSVGDAHHPGGLLPKPGARPLSGEPVEFLKEQQWKTSFATAWADTGWISRTLRGPGMVRPPAGGEAVLSASMSGLVQGDPWPYPGMAVNRGEAVLRLVPLVASDRSLSELSAAVQDLEAMLEPARVRLERLEGLLEKNAVSRREVEAARAEVQSLAARHEAAERNLATARSVRRGAGGGGEAVALEAPFTGRVSKVLVTRGQVVEAGEALARLVQSDPVWVGMALRPGEAQWVSGRPTAIHITGGGHEGVHFEGNQVTLVSRSPEVDPQTGRVSALFQVDDTHDQLILGAAVQVELGLSERLRGVVIPQTALVDDSGTPVVYVQESGESFKRVEVEVRARQGNRLLVEGLPVGSRLVTRGGPAIRRTTLVSSGQSHGHVH